MGIVGALAVLAAVLWFTPTSDYVILPGITENLNHIVQVRNGRPPAGRLLMVAITLEPANLFYYLYGALTPYGEVVPASELAAPGTTPRQYQQQSAYQMTQSHEFAKVAALNYLGYNLKETGDGVRVFYDLPKMPADGKVKANDVITAVDGVPVSTASDLLNYMKTHVTPGSDVSLTIRRDGRTIQITVGTKPSPSSKTTPLMGIAIGTNAQSFNIPVPITISSGDVTGPSAGMMFGLEIVSQMKPALNLTHGLTVAGTGEIEADGTVDPIGGIREKVITVYDAGAKVFLVPAANYAEALSEERALGITAKMPLIKVRTLRDAIDALKGMNLASLEREGAKLASP